MSDDNIEMKSALGALRNNAFNIQSLLKMVQKGEESTEILNQITEIIETHFDSAESLAIDITDEHIKDHREILKHLKMAHADWCDGKITDTYYAEVLNSRLYKHFSSHLQPLIDKHLDETERMKFKL
ncbi:hypothetical protein SAMN05660420_03333 [Desulfuromusa kysingii]|uniref:Hemerythrin HHE cation binding domain-containing protein n=1 Tax=Desulfuromusa kysingii TaxID=37625 RepID=A0A1H4EDY5_9BACT|nr:hypothetical protein [Desulfuromusa kysingii]SEA82938.1 hypothetical protein SAMN05660420_03333 [Desulfuromusa kysingii]